MAGCSGSSSSSVGASGVVSSITSVGSSVAGISVSGSSAIGSSSKLIRSGNGSECADAVAALVPASVASEADHGSSLRVVMSTRNDGVLANASARSESDDCHDVSVSLICSLVASDSGAKGESVNAASSASRSLLSGIANCGCPDRDVSDVAHGSTVSWVMSGRSASTCSLAKDVVGASHGSLGAGFSVA